MFHSFGLKWFINNNDHFGRFALDRSLRVYWTILRIYISNIYEFKLNRLDLQRLNQVSCKWIRNKNKIDYCAHLGEYWRWPALLVHVVCDLSKSNWSWNKIFVKWFKSVSNIQNARELSLLQTYTDLVSMKWITAKLLIFFQVNIVSNK